MARTHRLSMTGALIVCMIGTQWGGTLFASDEERLSRDTPSSQSLANGTSETQVPVPAHTQRLRFTINDEGLTANPFNFLPPQSSAFAGQIYRGRPIPMRGRRDGSVAALMIGAMASITGTAILVYANRPECSANRFASGCGYGTKVVGSAVLSGGIVGLFVGALTWK